ncbi:(2Fe-2S) ferredoxin domain-containing protein [Chamaesiphon sp. OTE_8_metabat_110]|uniref:(2Fe-2S) ferredoxin domain-containing protein n=1 Tax=Chamaesiphon sp. OTE_8_metabat_110 TaxID=2964696 RepID=UPI00286A5D8D|nr:(2Fe-2S) ferredoxin domain-containing protein [Chamaesiphon sp. OTE_8_metabat_110]
MGRQHHQHLQPLTGQFLGWGDDRTPHRYIKLATANGERRVKIAKSLRPQIQGWQPGIWLTLISQERICSTTGERKIKAKQLFYLPTAPTLSDLPALALVEPVAKPPTTKIQVCGGSSCRRRGSDNICQSMQAYLDRHDLTTQVHIETVKCLHQCKAAPHAIVTPTATTSGKTHYRQLQPSQVQLLLAKHFPILAPLPATVGTSLIEKIQDYLQQHQLASPLTSNS